MFRIKEEARTSSALADVQRATKPPVLGAIWLDSRTNSDFNERTNPELLIAYASPGRFVSGESQRHQRRESLSVTAREVAMAMRAEPILLYVVRANG